MKKINRKIFILSTIFGFFIASLSLAMVTWPPSPFFGTKLTTESKVGDMVKYFYEWGIALGGLAAFISLVIGGFQYLTSMGEPARLAEAKDRIRSAFFGLILLLGSWLILNTINPQLTKFSVEFVTPESPPSPISCTTNKDCKNENLECKNGQCVPKDPTGNPCKSAEIVQTGDIIPKSCQNLSKELSPGNTYSTKGNPSGCSGFIELYQRPNCEILVATVPAASTFSVDRTAKSAKLVTP